MGWESGRGTGSRRLGQGSAGLLGLLLASACASSGGGSGDGAQPGDTDSAGAASGGVAVAPLRLHYRVLGGFAGFDFALDIEPDGSATLVEGDRIEAQRQLSLERMAILRALAVEATPASSPEVYGRPSATVADGWTRTVEVNLGTDAWRLEEHPKLASPLPEPVAQLMNELMSLAMAMRTGSDTGTADGAEGGEGETGTGGPPPPDS